MEKAYAQALAQAVRRGDDEATLVAGLTAHLKREGRAKLLPGIVRELKRVAAAEATLTPQIEVASEAEVVAAQAAAREQGIDTQVTRINPDLIRGWRARAGSRLIDRSAKHALVDLYQRITN